MKVPGALLLLITAVLWGLAFVAQTDASATVEPFTFTASRNIVGVIFLSIIIAVRRRTGSDIPPVDHAPRTLPEYSRRTLLVGGIICGVVLFIGGNLQQIGITSYPPDAAASGRSGFITAIYMVLVALWGLTSARKPHPIVIVSAGVALCGMYFLCVPNGLGSIYFGDILVFACAIAYAAHIIVIDRYTQVDGVRLSRIQLATSFVLSLICALVFEHPNIAVILAAVIPILYAGICSDGIAYTLQIIGQKTTDPTVASVIMSLEAVFAALGGWFILNETLGAIEIFGCALVFLATMLAQAPQFAENARRKRELARILEETSGQEDSRQS